MNNTGYVWIPKDIEEREWYKNIPASAIFFHCLLSAKERPNVWRGHEIKKGDFYTTHDMLAYTLGLDLDQIISGLKVLEDLSEISTTSIDQGVVISVANFDYYLKGPEGDEAIA